MPIELSPSSGRLSRGRSSASGFTLVEVLVAIVILAFGLIAVTNLLVVAASSNSAGNHSTAATAQATEVLERLKAIPFQTLAAAQGGNLEADAPAECVDEPPANCVVPGTFNARRIVSGVGTFKTRWQINETPGDHQTLFITVRSESIALLVQRRSRAEFSTFRSCTAVAQGCPIL